MPSLDPQGKRVPRDKRPSLLAETAADSPPDTPSHHPRLHLQSTKVPALNQPDQGFQTRYTLALEACGRAFFSPSATKYLLFP